MNNEDIILEYFKKYGPQSMKHVKTYAKNLFQINEADTHRTVWNLIDWDKLVILSNSKIDFNRGENNGQ
jgi:hypothetical protein